MYFYTYDTIDESDEDSRDDTSRRNSGRQLVFRSSTTTTSGIVRPEIVRGNDSESTTPSRRNRKRRKVSSWVWNYFQKTDETIVCLKCRSICPSADNTFAASSSTSTLAYHLKQEQKIEIDGNNLDVTQATLSQ